MLWGLSCLVMSLFFVSVSNMGAFKALTCSKSTLKVLSSGFYCAVFYNLITSNSYWLYFKLGSVFFVKFLLKGDIILLEYYNSDKTSISIIITNNKI